MAKATDTAADQSTPAEWVRDAALLKHIGRFEVRKKLGQGGFGTVYRAFDPQLERDVAVKVPKTELLASPKSVERFLREAKAAARLNHPHIVPVYDAGRDGELNYIASAFIDGQPLAALIEQLAGDFRRIATLIRQLAEALDYAHSQGVIHRDVKPDNVMIDSAGQPHLMDFGLARIGDAAQKLTHDGTVMGTPAYMSPEQACDDPSAVTHASDQYSLGVVLYELLTGEVPFVGSPAIIIFNVLNQPIPAPRSLRADLPRDLETICLKAMAKESESRYVSCQEFAEDLRRWADGEPITARRVSHAERLVRWCQRNRVLASVIATAALLLITVAVISTVSAVRLKDLADREHNETLRANRETEKARELATANATLADQEKSAREKADRNADDALRQTKLAERHLYVAHMNLAQSAWEDERVGQTVRLLDLYRPVAGQVVRTLRVRAMNAQSVPATREDESDDLRGFEWFYWDRLCHSSLMDLKGHSGPVTSVAFNADGKRLASASEDGTVKVWDTTSGQETLTLKGHNGPVTSVAFSADGRRLASASEDQTVKVWDATSGQETLTLKGHTGRVWSVAFSADGKRLASASEDGTVKVWDSRPWTPELKVEQQAVSLIRFLFGKGLSKADVLQTIASDSTVTDLVRQRATELAGPLADNLAHSPSP